MLISFCAHIYQGIYCLLLLLAHRLDGSLYALWFLARADFWCLFAPSFAHARSQHGNIVASSYSGIGTVAVGAREVAAEAPPFVELNAPLLEQLECARVANKPALSLLFSGSLGQPGGRYTITLGH